MYVSGIASHIVSCIGSNTDPGPYNKGLIFLKDRDILLTGDKWTIAVNIALDDYLSLTKGMRFALAQIQRNIEAYRNPNRKDFDINWEEIKHLEQLVQGLEVHLESISKLLFEEIPSKDPVTNRIRNKTGLINLIGYGLKYLFGTADKLHLRTEKYIIKKNTEALLYVCKEVQVQLNSMMKAYLHVSSTENNTKPL
jgi:hypothetical protein